MERQITQFSEYSLTNNVEDLARLESQSFDGVAVIRVFLQPRANVPISAQNLVLPTGTAKVGGREYWVSLNSSPEAIAALTEVEASARLADESLALAGTAFQEGAGTQVDLIDAERSAPDAATAVAVATHDRDRARLALLIATGRLPFPSR